MPIAPLAARSYLTATAEQAVRLSMLDLLMVALIVGGFALMALYVAACERA